MTQFRVIVNYLQLLAFPTGLNLDHDIRPSEQLFDAGTLLSLVFLLALLALAIYVFPKNRFISFGIFWFFLTLAVESSIIPISDLMFEHRTYLPSFGFFLLITAGIFQVLLYEVRRVDLCALYVHHRPELPAHVPAEQGLEKTS